MTTENNNNNVKPLKKKSTQSAPQSAPKSQPPPASKSSTEPQLIKYEDKSVKTAYILWFFGGLFGAHHIYLHRDRQAFVWWCTLGGYFGIGWLSEIFTIPKLVRDTNEDPRFLEEFVDKLQKYRKPPFSMNRFVGAIMVGYLWGQVAMIAIPEEDYAGINWSFLHWIIPLFVGLGVWTVGNIGREKGVLWHCLLTAYLVYPIRFWVYDETIWFTGMVFVSAIIFDSFSKEWNRERPKRHAKKHRIICLSFAVCIYLSLWGCFFFFNGKITDGDGDEVPVHEAIHHFFTSPWWTDLKQTLHDTWQYAQHNGWYEVWKQIIENMDVDGEQNAYKVLGVSPTASQTEITSHWRKLSREHHPDKVKDETKQRAAQEKFMEIQQAYEVLSKIKSKRRSKNKKFNDEI